MEIGLPQNNTRDDFTEILNIFAIAFIINLVIGAALIVFSPEKIPWAYEKGEFIDYESKYSLLKIPLFSIGWIFVGFLLYRITPLIWKTLITLFPWNKPINYKALRFLFGIEINDSNVIFYLRKLVKSIIITGLILIPTIYIPMIGMAFRTSHINTLFSLYVVLFVVLAVVLLFSLSRKNIKGT